MSKLEEIIERAVESEYPLLALVETECCRRACRRAVREALREVAKLARYPYADQVGAYGSDEPCAVGLKIALAIETLAAELGEKWTEDKRKMSRTYGKKKGLEEIIERVVKEILPPRPDLPEFMSGTAMMAWNKAQDETERVIKAACRRAARGALLDVVADIERWAEALRSHSETTMRHLLDDLRAVAAELEDKP